MQLHPITSGSNLLPIRRKCVALRLAVSLLLFGLVNTLHASLGIVTEQSGDYYYNYYGPVVPYATLHADLAANFIHPDIMWEFEIRGENYPFIFYAANLRKAPDGNWWAEGVVVNGIEHEFQNLGPDPFSWGLQIAYAEAGTAVPGAWMSCHFGYPPATYRPSTVSMSVNGTTVTGGMHHILVQGGETLTFGMSASALGNNYPRILLSVTSGQDESDWLLGSNTWQNLYYSSSASGSFSYTPDPNVRHHYFLARSDGNTISAPAIIHAEVSNNNDLQPNTIWGSDIYVSQEQDIWFAVDYGSVGVDSTRGVSEDGEGNALPFQYMISGYTRWVTVHGYSDAPWTPPAAGDYQIYYKQSGDNEWASSNIAGPYTIHAMPANASVTAKNISAPAESITQATFTSAMTLNLAPGLSYTTHVIISNYGTDPNFNAIPVGTYTYQIEIEPNYAQIYGNFPSSFISPSYTLTVTLPPPSSLTATVTDHATIVLSWTASPTIGAAYELERKLGVSGTYAKIANIPAGATTYTDTGFNASTAYTYRIRAILNSQVSDYSAEASATAPPLTPSGLMASYTTSNGAIIKWMAPTGSIPVIGYQILLDGIVVGATNDTSYALTGLTPATNYTITVWAMDAANNMSASYTPLSITTLPVNHGEPPTLPLDWANKHHLDPFDPLGDSSGDGLSNIAKYNLGIEPNDIFAGSSASGDTVPAIMSQAGFIDTTYAVGTTPGDFAVDKNGAATYSIPVAVTPGSAGMQPSISLEYGSANGPGIAGYGWSLAGLSSVIRCGQSMSLDGQLHAMDFTYADRFVFDGQRLMAISGQDGCDGTEYRFESDNFTRVVSYGSSGQGPAWFKAWTKSGLIVEFGNTSDSSQKIGGRSEVMSWQVSKISDTAGNYMTFEYIFDPHSGQQVVSRINYTGNARPVGYLSTPPYASIRFEYENRPDVRSGYIKGAKVVSNLRLAAIKVCYGEETVRQYTLSYVNRLYNNRSILASVTESGADGKSYIPITFEYSDPPLGWDDAPVWTPPVVLAGASNNAPLPSQGVAFIDLDGDGRVDCVQKMVWYEGSYPNRIRKTKDNAWLNKASGWVPASGGAGQFDYRLPDSCVLSYNNIYTTDTGVRFIDLNGDGLVDIMNNAGEAYLNTGTGFVHSERFSLPDEPPIDYGGSYNYFSRGRIEVIDLDGDGLPDVSAFSGIDAEDGWDYYYNEPQTTYMHVPDTWINTGGGEEGVRGSAWKFEAGYQLPHPSDQIGVRYADINGDGLVDVVRSYSSNGVLSAQTLINTGSGFVESKPYRLPLPFGKSDNGQTVNYTGAELVDLNGDGLPDFICGNVVLLNTGNGWTPAPDGYAMPVPSVVGSTPQGCVFIDINNDGLVDLVQSKDSNTRCVWLNTGTDWRQMPASLAPPRQIYQTNRGSAGAELNDFNGDGAVDQAWNWDGDGYTSAGAVTNRRINPDRLTTVKSSLGVALRITYAPLTELDPQSGQPTVYENDSRATPPKADISAPMHVVKMVSNDDGCGGTYDIAYRYGNLRAELRCGLLGFEWMQVTDMRTSIKTRTYFSQDYPTIGMTTGLVTTAPDGTVLNETASTLGWCYSPNTDDKVRFACALETLQKTYELNGALTSTTDTTYDYDDYGNVTSVIVNTSDDTGTYEKTSINQYDNWVSQPSQSSLNCWMLGRLKRSSVTTQAPNVPVQTRTSSFEYDTTTGLLTKETIEPDAGDDSPLKLTTTYAHDSFGNKTKATTTGFGLGVNGRSVSTTYDTKGRFPLNTQNALGHFETYAYNQKLGIIEKTNGPNGITTTWEYDGFARQTKETRACNTDSQTQTFTDYLWPTAAAAPGSAYLIRTESTGSAPAITFYDKMGRAIAGWAVNPGGLDKQTRVVASENAYDSYGRAWARSVPHYIEQTGANIHWSKTAYDILNRPTVIATPDDDAPNGEVVSTIEYNGLVTRTTNPLGQVEEATKNTQGQIIKRINNANAGDPSQRGEIHYAYDAYGSLLQTAVYRENSSNPVITSFVYDNRGRKIEMTDPDMGTWSYSYNAAGELTSQTDAKGQATALTCDILGRMTQRTDADGTVTTWTYDTAAYGKGKLASLEVTAPGAADYTESLEYDSLGRPIAHTMVIDGVPYTTRQEYDTSSRPSVMTYPDGLRVKNCYNALGFLKEVRADNNTILAGYYGDVLPNQLFWQADSYTVAGAIDGATYGNGLTYDAIVSPITGRTKAITASVCTAAGGYYAINHTYEHDPIGQVTRRFDQVAHRDEHFTYDGLNRLVSYNTNGGAPTTVSYDPLGNIIQKSDVGNYYYNDPGGRPHAITSAGANSYAYDNNGNQTSGAGRTLEWSSANQVRKITNSGNTLWTTFRFGASRERIVQQRKNGAGYTTTTYVGSAYEVVTHPDGLREEKCHIFTPLGRTATRTVRNDGKIETRYYHQDGLGSIVAVSDEYGRIEERFAFDPWGSRTALVTTRTENGGEITRGFTDHEHLDDFGLIHMNGRVFDPILARFLSADPMIGDSGLAQAYNRYSYVENNPLNATDPSGYFSFSKLLPTIIIIVVCVVITIATYGAASAVWGTVGWGGFFSTVVAGAAAGFAGGFLSVAMAGGSLGDAFMAGLKGGAIGALTAAASFGIGTGFNELAKGTGIWADNTVNWAGRTLAHATVGGVNSELQGDKFCHGFYSSAVSTGFSHIKGVDSYMSNPKNILGKTLMQAAIGGTAAAVGGGKFANGAITSAIQYVTNQIATESEFERLKNKKGKLVVLIEESIANRTDSSGGKLMDDIENKIDEFNSLFRRNKLEGRITWASFDSLDSLKDNIKNYVTPDTLFCGVVAHGVFDQKGNFLHTVNVAGVLINGITLTETLTTAAVSINPKIGKYSLYCDASKFRNFSEMQDFMKPSVGTAITEEWLFKNKGK